MPFLESEFQRRIAYHYKQSIKQQIGLPDDQIWTEAAQLLGKSRTTIWRWGQKKNGERPMEDLFRYLAAKNMDVKIERARTIVLLSLADTLAQIKSKSIKHNRENISFYEVEILRYLSENPQFIDPHEGINEMMIDKMQVEIEYAIQALNLRSKSEKILAVRNIVKKWRKPWVELLEILPYKWIYWSNCRL